MLVETSPPRNEPNNNEKKEKKSLLEKARAIKDMITVEPMISAFLIPILLSSLAIQNLNLDKACRVNLNYGDEICDNLIVQKVKNLSNEEAEVQKLVNNMTAWKVPLQAMIPAITILFVGAWSDRTGKRKICMTFPILGDLIATLGLILCTYYFYEWPLEVAGVFEGLPPAIFGGQTMLVMGAVSFLAENTTPEERTFRIGIANMFITLSIPIGYALSGVLLKTVKYYGVFSISVCCYIAAFTYGMLRIKDKNVKKNTSESWNSLATVSSALDTFKVAIVSRPFKKRRRIILLIFCFISISSSSHAAFNLNYLFTRRKHHFTEIEFSIFACYSVLVHLVGVIFAITILSKRLKMDDNLLAAIACTTNIFSSILMALAPTKGWFFAAPLVEIIYSAAVIAVRSIATKLVDEEENAKMNSLIGFFEALMNTIYSPIFTQIYNATVTDFPGAFHLVAGGLKIPAIVIFMYLYRLQKWEDSAKADKKESDDSKMREIYDNAAFM